MSDKKELSFKESLDLIVEFVRTKGLYTGISLLVYEDKSVFVGSGPIVLVHSKNEDENSSLLCCCEILQYIVDKHIKTHIKVKHSTTDVYNQAYEHQRPATTITCTYGFSHERTVIASTKYSMISDL